VTIDPYETSSEIQISAQDSLGTWSSVIRSTITLRNSRPYQNLKSVEITNKPTEFTPGKSFQLYFNAYDDAGRPIDISTLNVRWSLTGNNSTGTTIDNSGRVTIDPYESSSELRITLEVLGVAPIYGIGDTFILKSTNPYRVTVIRISPLNSATNVPIKGQIVVEFSGPVSRSLGTLTLNGVKTNLSAPVYSSSDKVLTYDYDGLLNLTNYTIELSSFRDYANNNPIETFSSKFTTIGHPTTVAVVSPAAGKTDVPASGNIVVTFNNEISKLGTIRLYGNKITHVIEISLSELTLTADKKSVVTLYQNLDKGEYMIEISGFVDGSGNVVPTFQSKFQTSDEGAASLAEVSQASESSAANEITLNPVSVNGTVATLSWNVPALTASNFTIERSDAAANPTFKQIAKVNASTSKTAYTYSDRTVKNGISYLYRIKAFDQNGKQVLKTAQVGVWVSTQKAKFTLEALDGNAVRIKLTSPVSGAEGYDILRSTSANGTYTKIASIKSGSTFTDTNENSDKRIYYRVIPYKSVQNVKYYSAPSDKVSIATSAVKTPVVKLSSKKTGQVTVSWQPSENAGSYRIYRSTSPDSGFKNIKTVKDTTQSSYVSTGLVSGTTYYFKIVAYDKDNNRASTSTVKSIAAK
jgi:methionine-rich copper-binding protein CopC